MPAPHAHDHSPPAGERDSPGRNPRDGGGASHGLTAAEQSSAVPGTQARFGRQVCRYNDTDRTVRRGNHGWPLHEMRPLNGRATDEHSEGGVK